MGHKVSWKLRRESENLFEAENVAPAPETWKPTDIDSADEWNEGGKSENKAGAQIE